MCGCLRLRSETLAEHIGVLLECDEGCRLFRMKFLPTFSNTPLSAPISPFPRGRGLPHSPPRLALKLSHVWQRFRSVIMRVSCLWSYVYNGMAPRIGFSALCERLTGPIAEIVLNGPSYCSRIKASKFARIVVGSSRTLVSIRPKARKLMNMLPSCWHPQSLSQRTSRSDTHHSSNSRAFSQGACRSFSGNWPQRPPKFLSLLLNVVATPRLHSFTVSNSIPVHFSRFSDSHVLQKGAQLQKYLTQTYPL